MMFLETVAWDTSRTEEKEGLHSANYDTEHNHRTVDLEHTKFGERGRGNANSFVSFPLLINVLNFNVYSETGNGVLTLVYRKLNGNDLPLPKLFLVI